MNMLAKGEEQQLKVKEETAENSLLDNLIFLTILFLVLVGYETERKKSHKPQLDRQLISNILKQVCMLVCLHHFAW